MSKMYTTYENAPWYKFYGDVPRSLDYPDRTVSEILFSTARKYPKYYAYAFQGSRTTYEEYADQVRVCAKALRAIGIKPNDRVTVALPNTPHAIIMFYAINVIGAVANMIHPLSAEGEIEFFLRDSGSVAAITLDGFYSKFARIRANTKLRTLIIARIPDFLNPVKKVGYKLTLGRKIAPLPADAPIITWKDFIAMGERYTGEYVCKTQKASDCAAILYSGGTTGKTKGILLSNANFNATAYQTGTMANCAVAGNTMLTVLPMFHGFGLCVCLHLMVCFGCQSLLIPRFTPETYAEMIKKFKPNYIAGVPTLFEAVLRSDALKNADLSSLQGVFSGGDSLPPDLKHRFDAFLKAHGSPVTIREGYGTTECVTASCLTPMTEYREGSIGIPFSDTLYAICDPNTNDELPFGTEGEICIHGPSVMLGYANQPEETAHTLRVHDDGKVWLHTGDLGTIDKDGFVYFKQRLKRMIITSGYNVYPSQIENILSEHPAVSISCAIGVPDPVKMQKIKVFVVLLPGNEPSDKLKGELFEHMRRHIAKYAMPYDIEFRDSLPTTLVGKVAYTKLEAEEAAKRAQ